MESKLAIRFATIKKFSELTGYSEDAVRSKIKRGDWLRDHMFRKAPDGRILMDVEAFNDWVENGMLPLPELLSVIRKRNKTSL